MTEKKANGKIIPFRQETAFYMKRGAKQMEKNDLLSALCRYRQAYESDPSNVDSCLAVAELLYQMQRYEESNRLLLLYISMYEPAPECFFGIACNYFGMHEFDYASESLETYLRLDPDGTYAYDAEDFLDMLDDDDALAEATGISDDEDFDTLTICTRAKHLLDAGETEIAVGLLKEHLHEVPAAWRAWNLLAVAQYCAGDRKGAKETTDIVLAEDPQNRAALCSRILLLHAEGKEEEALALLDGMHSEREELPETLSSIAVLQLELGRLKAAKNTLAQLYAIAPYDTNVLHQMGYCARQMEAYEEAQKCYRKLLRIDPRDTVAHYYLLALKNAQDGAQSRPAYWSLAYRVPLPEMLRRLNHVNRLFSLPEPELRKKWEQEQSFRDLLNWVLTVQDEKTKRAILSFYFLMGDRRAEYELRSFLLRTDQPDGLKRETLGLLKRLNAKEPYMAYLGSQWVQGSVSVMLLPNDMPESYGNILRFLAERLTMNGQEQAAKFAMQVLKRYLEQFEGRYPRISVNQQSSFAAALELIGRQLDGQNVAEQELCQAYKVTPIRLKNALAKFEPFREEQP